MVRKQRFLLKIKLLNILSHLIFCSWKVLVKYKFVKNIISFHLIENVVIIIVVTTFDAIYVYLVISWLFYSHVKSACLMWNSSFIKQKAANNLSWNLFTNLSQWTQPLLYAYLWRRIVPVLSVNLVWARKYAQKLNLNWPIVSSFAELKRN